MDGAIKNVTLLGHAPYDTAKYEKRAKVSIFTHVIPRQSKRMYTPSANFFRKGQWKHIYFLMTTVQ